MATLQCKVCHRADNLYKIAVIRETTVAYACWNHIGVVVQSELTLAGSITNITVTSVDHPNFTPDR